MIRPIHPFPARMAPELAIAELTQLKPGSVVLDPMAGSGTVIRHASALGLHAIGFDMDPLAVLMTRVWTTMVDDASIECLSKELLAQVEELNGSILTLPWIDDDPETKAFVNYWFGAEQQKVLRRISYALANPVKRRDQASLDVLKVALSRIIITKEQGASLARDVSHSRPHKVAESSDYDVMPAFQRSIDYVRRLLVQNPPSGRAEIRLGDARALKSLNNGSVDGVVTSPPYLNAIDYMRGHRMSLVWLGHSLSALRRIRSDSIGAERAPDQNSTNLFTEIQESMVSLDCLANRHRAMVMRYAEDLYRLTSEIARVLRTGGRAILVVGNSCLKGNFIRNSDGAICAGNMVGLRVAKLIERDLPNQSRYLPMTSTSLGKRMRTETVISFVRQ